MKSRTIVFIHGMYMTPLCWEHWVDYFNAQGYNAVAIPWPGRDRPVELLRDGAARAELGQLTLTQVLNGLTVAIKSLDEKPILIGHSMGGLAVQLLLQKGLGSAGVAIDSAPPMGVITLEWPFLKSNWPHITPFASLSNPVEMTFERFQYTFVNGFPLEEQRAAFDRYVVPESRRVPRESLTARIDFTKHHPPLLLIAGTSDHLIPSTLIKTNYDRYKTSPSVTNFREFEGRTHFIIGQKDWKEVADYVCRWVDEKVV